MSFSRSTAIVGLRSASRARLNKSVRLHDHHCLVLGFLAAHVEMRSLFALAAARLLPPPPSSLPFSRSASTCTARGAHVSTRSCVSARRARTNALLAPPLETGTSVVLPRPHTFALSTATPLVASAPQQGRGGRSCNRPLFRRRVCFYLCARQCRFLAASVAACSVRQHFMETPVPNPAFERTLNRPGFPESSGF
jgi:hypothetical protein